ncbi:transcription factor RelB [Boleophthalmus pectinirostris]|uniref:transcription factor RelB n=1 Tax=Boleophthalmus pectinirostris TaxID=150288 RepID=UPI000A1C572F|nr:transcription factor RelB [Boleophthalmus pectinirostris]
MMATPPSCSLPGTELLERVLERPALVVVEEPKDRGMRFRYECEGRSAGSILGASSTESSKTQPAIEIQGPIDHIKKVKITVSLVTKDIPHRPHPHCLVGKDCPPGSGICVVTFNPHVNRRHSFANLGIQCVRRKELEASLQKRRSQNIDPFQTDYSRGIEDIDMNAVRLCFQCELEWEDGKKDCLKPVVSKPIYDKKATTTSQLKITRLNLDRGPCTGKTEVYMLCDKVQKDDIEIVFRRDSWKANGEFAQTDVHRQVGIVFKTPPYQDQNITEEVEVSLCLRRISDQMESEPVTFIYSPRNPDPYEVKRKRKIKSDMSFTERACTSEKNASTTDPFQISPNPPGSTPSSEEHLRLQPGPFQAEVCCMEAQCSNMAPDEASLINQLMEMPGFMDIFSDPSFSSLPSGFDQGPEASTTFTNLDMNSGPYFQDFSHYNDLQFNMLVNENQTASSEMVQVKTEDEL